MITGRELIEKMYSNSDSELDELLERAFCEGYEYAQREFAKYNAPISPDKANKVSEQLKDMTGVGGKTLDQVAKNIAKKAPKMGLTKEALQKKAKEVAKAAGKSGMAGRNIAKKLNGGELYLIKKGLM